MKLRTYCSTKRETKKRLTCATSAISTAKDAISCTISNKQCNTHTIGCVGSLNNSPNRAFFTSWMRCEHSNKRLDKCLNIISICFLCSSIIGLVTNKFPSSNWTMVPQRALHSTHIGNRTDIPSNGIQARGLKTYCTQ